MVDSSDYVKWLGCCDAYSDLQQRVFTQ